MGYYNNPQTPRNLLHHDSTSASEISGSATDCMRERERDRQRKRDRYQLVKMFKHWENVAITYTNLPEKKKSLLFYFSNDCCIKIDICYLRRRCFSYR